MNEENKQIDKNKFIDILWSGLYEMAFLDIKRASDGNSKMGAFILASCFIDYLAGFRYGKESRSLDYKNFVKDYMFGKYNKDKLYHDLRCKLVHNYSEGGSYIFTDSQPEFHLMPSINGKTIINLENFIEDIEIALNEYFSELKKDNRILQLATNRFLKINILTVFSTQIIDSVQESE